MYADISSHHVEGKRVDKTVWSLLNFHAYVKYHVKVICLPSFPLLQDFLLVIPGTLKCHAPHIYGRHNYTEHQRFYSKKTEKAHGRSSSGMNI